MDKEDIKKFVAMLCSEDLSNVLLAIEMFEPLHHYDKEAFADEFLKHMTGEIINMYINDFVKTDTGVWAMARYYDPIPHTAFGIKIETEWSYWVEMMICQDTLEESAHMSGKGNFHAVGFKLYIESHGVHADSRVHEGYNSFSRVHEGYNPFYKCMEFFFKNIAPIIRNYINGKS